MSSRSSAVAVPGWTRVQSRPAIAGTVARTALPVCLSALLVLMLPVANTVVIGQHDPGSLFALALVFPVAFLVISMNESLRVSSLVFSAEAAGSGDIAALRVRLRSLLALGVLLHVGIALAFLLCSGAFMTAFAVPAGQRAAVLVFAVSTILAYAPAMASTVLSSALFGFGLTWRVTAMTVVTVCANIAVTAVLVIWAGWGLLALPASAVITSVAGIAWSLVHLRRVGVVRWAWPSLGPVSALVGPWRDIRRISLPVYSSYLLVLAGGLVLNHVLAVISPADVAGFGIANRIQSVLHLPGIALGVSLAVTVNRMRGAGVHAPVPSFVSTTLAISVAFYAVIAAVVFASRAALPLLMTGDGAIAASAEEYLTYMGPAFLASGPLLTMVVFLEEIGHGARAFVCNVGLFAVRVAVVLALASMYQTAAPIYRGFAASYVLALAFIAYELFRGRPWNARAAAARPAATASS